MSEVARRWQVCPQQVFGWRREARQNMVAEASKPRAGQTSDFAPILSEVHPPATLARKAAATAPMIEVKLAGAVVRVSGRGDGAELTAVLRAIRASALDP